MNHFKNISLEDIPDEIWKDIAGWENQYQVSNLGNIRSLDGWLYYTRCNRPHERVRYGKIIRQTVSSGYKRACITRTTNKIVHRLVAIAFVPNPLNLPEVNHIDGDKLNNRWDNLEWVTRKQNQEHAVKMGRYRVGADNTSTKLSIEEVVEIRGSTLSTGVLSKLYGISTSNIRDILKRKIWKHV